MTPPPRPLGRGLMILLAVSVFAGAGTIHYQTPMLGAFAAEFNADAAAAGWVATLTFGGFLAGTFFLVPLGDRFDKRRLILAELAVLIVALLAMAAAPSLAALALASLVVGITAGFAQLVIPLTAELAPPATRGRVMGALLACLFLGILFGRVAGGLIAEFLGWRWTYVAAAGRWTARRGAFPIVTGGVCLVLAAYVAFAFAPLWVGAVIAGAVLLDCGLRSALVANQTLITSVAPETRSRFNTVFGAHIWGGNAVGAFLASTALAHSGWLAVCTIALSASCLALLVQWRSRPARGVS